MFLLSETELFGSISLKNISRIDVSFYKSVNESLNIFNLESDFDENLIPLITSTLECKPVLIRRKTYSKMNTNYIIEQPITCNSNLGSNHGSNLGECSDNKGRFPSFHLDIDAFNKNKNSSNQKTYYQTQKLHYSNVYIKSQELVRIYSREDSDSDSNGCRDVKSNTKIFNPQDTLCCKEEIVIYWLMHEISKFELCISPKENKKKCIWHIVVDVIEDNNFIDTKVDAVNTWLEKIHKIKSTIKLANQDTNTKEI